MSHCLGRNLFAAAASPGRALPACTSIPGQGHYGKRLAYTVLGFCRMADYLHEKAASSKSSVGPLLRTHVPCPELVVLELKTWCKCLDWIATDDGD